MKTNYNLKTTILLLVLALCLTTITAQENVRILRLDPATNSVTLKNFGDADAPISEYWFCNVPAYEPVSEMTSTTTLAPNEEINLATNSINFPVSSGEFGLYNTNAFGSSEAMLDFLQWGTGNSGSSRESVAVAAGLWVADTFVTVAPPFAYGGDGTQNGVANWSTLGLDDFTQVSSFKLYPNPTKAILNVALENINDKGNLQIFDMLGKQIYAEAITTQTSQINIADWDNGLYVIKIKSEQKEETKRFIKN